MPTLSTPRASHSGKSHQNGFSTSTHAPARRASSSHFAEDGHSRVLAGKAGERERLFHSVKKERTAAAFIFAGKGLKEAVAVVTYHRLGGLRRLLRLVAVVPPRDRTGDVQVLRAHEQRQVSERTMHVRLAAPPAFGAEVRDARELFHERHGFTVFHPDLSTRAFPLRAALDFIKEFARADTHLRLAIANEVIVPEWKIGRLHRLSVSADEMHAAGQGGASVRVVDRDTKHRLGARGSRQQKQDDNVHEDFHRKE
jgi:hypothetical protein